MITGYDHCFKYIPAYAVLIQFSMAEYNSYYNLKFF
jgi:hypothetical protein